MTVPFNHIPKDLRIPFFHVEMDNSRANTTTGGQQRALLAGQSLSQKLLNEPVLCPTYEKAVELFGAGSMLAGQVKSFRRANTSTELWCLPLADADAATAAEGKVEISGTSAVNGVISLYIANYLVSVPVSKAETADDIASSVADTVNADPSLYVSAKAEASVVTLTAKFKGLAGNDIILSLNNKGSAGGEETPEGLTIKLTAMSGGLLNPNLADGFANLGDEEYDFVSMGYNDTTSLDASENLMNDTTGRWSYEQQIYGHSFTATRVSLAEAQTLGKSRNDPHITILPFYKSDTPCWEVSAIMTAVAAASLSNDPARPLQTLPMPGFMAPPVKDRFQKMERNTLLWNGMSTFNVQSGTCCIEKLITSYRVNNYGSPDDSYLDIETLFTSMAVIRYLRSQIETKYGRCKLAKDGTRFAEGQPIVTPSIIRNELISCYSHLEKIGLVENTEEFAKNLIVEIAVDNPRRLDVLFAPDYVNPLNVFAMLNQFRLQY